MNLIIEQVGNAFSQKIFLQFNRGDPCFIVAYALL